MKKIFFFIVTLVCAINSNSKIKASNPMDHSRINLVAGAAIITGSLMIKGATKIAKRPECQKLFKTNPILHGFIFGAIAGAGGGLIGAGSVVLVQNNKFIRIPN